MKNRGSNTSTIKADNNSLILSYIRHQPISRADICKATGLSKSSVTTITKQLIEEGQLIEIGTESTSSGRHPILLDIVKDRRYAIAIHLSRTEVTVAIVNLKFEAVESVAHPIGEFTSPCDVLGWCYEKGIGILKNNNIDMTLCLGIGIAAPGPIDYKNGIILTPPNFALFENFNVKEFFKKITDMPVFLNNVPVLMAMYEHSKRRPEIKNYMFVTVDSGIGSAIMQNGSVYRGSAGFSGELGHTTVDIKGPLCSCGNKGCLEMYVTRRSIERNCGISSYNDMIDAAYENDEKALAIVGEAASYFAGGIVNAINMFDLDAVIIYGELNYRYKLLLSKIQKEVDHRSIVTKAHPVKVLPSLIAENDVKVFAAANVIDKYFRQTL